MNNKRPKVTYIIDGKEETKTLNFFNYDKIKKELFENDNMLLRSTFILKDNIEFIKFENFIFEYYNFNIKPNSIVIFDNCTFNKNYITLCDNKYYPIEDKTSKVKFINPTCRGYLKIISKSLNNLEVFLDKEIDYKLIIYGNADTFSLEGNLNNGEVRLDAKKVYFNNVYNILSLSLNPSRTIEDDIMTDDSVTINDSEISLDYHGYCDFDQINTSHLILNNASIFKKESGDEFCKLRIKADKLSGTNFSIKVPNDIEIGNIVYKKKENTEYLFLTEKILNDPKNQLIRGLILDFKGIEQNIEGLYISPETKKIQENYSKKILRHQADIEENKQRSQKKVKKLERKLKSKKIGSYYQE